MKYTLKSMRFLAATFITFGSLAGGADAAVIVNNLSAPFLTTDSYDYGQSFTTSAATSWNNIIINFLSNAGSPASVPFAAGTLFLLEAEFLGFQAGLSSSTPGFIAQTSDVSGGTWTFAPSVALEANKQYWIFTQGGAITPIAYSDSNAYSGGISYFDVGSGYEAADLSVDLGFSIAGTAIPEPSAALLSCLAIVGVVCVRRRTT